MSVLKRLIKIRDEGPEDPSMGICSNACLSFMEERLMKKWPEFSGHPSYPIKSQDSRSALKAYYETSPEDAWNPDHPYGAARLRLLDFLIAELEKETA